MKKNWTVKRKMKLNGWKKLKKGFSRMNEV